VNTERPVPIGKVMQALGLDRDSVGAIDPKELPHFRVGRRGDRRYLPSDVDAYIARRQVGR
jgi:hypothetical protein